MLYVIYNMLYEFEYHSFQVFEGRSIFSSALVACPISERAITSIARKYMFFPPTYTTFFPTVLLCPSASILLGTGLAMAQDHSLFC